jgi:hypothetical protein
MPQNTNLNRTPYFDDFDTGKNFYRILFRPGYSIQARELTQLQSMLQNQLESVGNSMFKQGQMVIPGEVSYTDTYEYVKLSSVSQVAQNVNGAINFVKYDISQLVGKTIVGQTSGVKAFIDNYAYETTLDSDTIFVKYISSGSDNIDVKFRQGESLKLENATTDDDPTLVVGSDGIKPSDSLAMGYGSAVNVQQGIYFINGHFVKNDAQTLILSKYVTNTSYKVGWSITESIITPEDDISLKDNAQGYSNFSAPGAHRLKITLSLEKFAIDVPSNKNFVQLVYLQQGKIQRQIKQTPPSQIEEILARRTYDESGDYVVKAMTTDIKEYYNNDGSGFYQTDTDGKVNGLDPTDAADKLVLNLGPGKAYIRGYEVENTEPKYIDLDKAKAKQSRDKTRLYAASLSRIPLRSVAGSVPISATADGEATPFKKVNLYRKFIDSYLGVNGSLNSTTTGVFSVDDLRGTVYTNSEAVMTVWVYAGTSPNNGDVIDLSTVTDPVYTNLVLGNKKTLYHYNGATYAEIDVIAARANLMFKNDVDGTVAWASDTGTGGLNEGSGGNPAHVVQEFIIRAPIATLTSITASYQSHGPSKIGGSATDGICLYGDGSGTTKYGMILDYTMPVTPIIGRAIARDFKYRNSPNGYDKTTNVIASGTQQDCTFDLSYTNPILFTKVKLTGIHAFNTGANIIGSVSGTTAVVEGGLSVGQNDPENATLSHATNLMLSNVVGEFVQGEEIYDADDSEKSAVIATNGRISHFTVPYGGQNYNTTENLQLKIGNRTYLSNYIIVSRETAQGIAANANAVNYVHNVRFTELGRRDILDTFTVPPTCVVVDDSTHSASDPDAYVRAVLHTDVIQNFGIEDIRSLGMEHGQNLDHIFTGDIQYADPTSTDLITITSNLQYSGKIDCDYIEATNYSARPADELIEDDLIQITIEGVTYRYEVARACNPSTDRTGRILLKQRLLSGFTSNTVSRVRPRIENSGKSTLLLPLANSKIAGTVASDDDSGITYYSRRQFIEPVTIDGTNNTVSIAAQLDYGQQQFVPFSQSDYVLEIYDVGDETVRYNDSNGELLKDGDLLYVDDSMVSISSGSSTNNAGSLQINLPDGYFHQVTGSSLTLSNMKLKINATIETSKANPKLKTATKNNRISLTADLDNEIIPLRGDNYDNPTGQVKSFSDVYKLRYVYEGSPGIAPTVDENGAILGNSGTDITDFFLFDDGQRDNLYDTATIIRKPGVRTPTGTLVIGFDYFKHSEGDFFTVDSYLHENGVKYEDIPTINSLVYGKKSLADVIDFRPLVGTSASIPGYVNASVMDDNSSVSEVYTTGGVSAALPADTKTSIGTPFTFACSYTYYVDRIDTIYLKKDGSFIVKKGAGSTNPQSAETVDEAIKIFKVYIPAFTDNLKKIKIFPIENKRFTMSDITKLEKKIERLERYTMLSVLEQGALNTQIKDPVSGMDKFKSGFVVDNFESYSLAHINSVDYKASLDLTRGTLRPESKETTVNLIEIDSAETTRTLSNYVVNNHVVSLPFTETVFCQNIFATNTTTVNPFLIFNYKGTVDITPNVDPWFDENVLPSVNNNDSQTLDPLEVYSDGDTALSQIHNITQIAVTGNETEFSNVNSLSSDAPDLSQSEVLLASTGSSSNIAAQNTEVPLQQSSTTVGDKVLSTSLTLYVKEQYIEFHLRRMKPNTRIFGFLDGLAISDYVVPDRNYSGLPGSSLRNWGDTLTTDDNGSATGIILFPSGRKPLKGTQYETLLDDNTYDTTQPGLRFPLGDKKIRFSSSSNNATNPDTYATVIFKASAIKDSAPNDIIALESLDNSEKVDGTQYTENILNPDVSVSDPLAQTFRVESFEGGVMASSIDLYFSAKDASLPITVKLVDTIAGRPSKNILPGSTSVMDANTYVRVITSGSHTLIQNEIVEGDTSNAQGPLIGVLDSQNQPVAVVNATYTLGTAQVYTLILGDHNKEDFIPGEPLVLTSLTVANNSRSGDDVVKMQIVLDSGYVSEIIMDDMGDGYAGSTTVTVESPQLPGGVTATAVPQITDQKVYEVQPSLGGSEYTTAPSVLIVSSSATQLASAKAVLKITKPAVRMGVATSDKALVPTKFKFQYPVYLENDREYAVIIESNSTLYQTFLSRLGETEINSNSTVTTQPLLGSLFKSQNSNLWTENQYEDLKFDLYMAQFDTTKSGVIDLVNGDQGYELLGKNPIETNATGANTTSSQLFASNNKVIKVLHRNHGLNKGSFVALKDSSAVGGFSTTALNRQILTVLSAGIDFYTVGMTTIAGGSVIGGGTNVKGLGQTKFEKALVKVDSLDFPSTTLATTINTTLVKPIDSEVETIDYSPDTSLPVILNKEYYFPTQRVVASKLNEKLFASRLNNKKSFGITATLSTNNANLSPIISLKNPKAILTTNRIEAATGTEDRYGRKVQEVELYKTVLLSFSDATNTPLGTTSNIVTSGGTGETIKGLTSGTRGILSYYDNGQNPANLYVRIIEGDGFVLGENIEFGGSSPYNLDLASKGNNTGTTGAASGNLNLTRPLKITGSLPLAQFNISSGDNITNSSYTSSEAVGGKTGTVTRWNRENFRLTLTSNGEAFDKTDLIGKAGTDTLYSGGLAIINETFKVPISIKKVYTSYGYLFTPDRLKNSSGVATYVTKEISLDNPANGISLMLNSALQEIDDVVVMYKIKRSSQQIFFKDINWSYFNETGKPDFEITPTSGTGFSPTTENQSDFKEYQYSISGLKEFSSFAIKVIMKTKNPALPPRIRDLRAIATF